MNLSTPGLPVHYQLPELPKLMPIESGMLSNHLILCRPLLLLPSIFPSIRVFSNESALHIRWPKYWSFSFNISPSNEHPGPISFRMDWLDLPAVQGTLESLLWHHSSEASSLQRSAFSMVQLSPPSVTTGKLWPWRPGFLSLGVITSHAPGIPGAPASVSLRSLPPLALQEGQCSSFTLQAWLPLPSVLLCQNARQHLQDSPSFDFQ